MPFEQKLGAKIGKARRSSAHHHLIEDDDREVCMFFFDEEMTRGRSVQRISREALERREELERRLKPDGDWRDTREICQDTGQATNCNEKDQVIEGETRRAPQGVGESHRKNAQRPARPMK